MLNGPDRIVSQGGPNLGPPCTRLNGRAQAVSDPDTVDGLQRDRCSVERGLNAVRPIIQLGSVAEKGEMTR